MTNIPTWHERAMRHPDHQSGMVSEGMLRARMGEEIADLRAEIKRLRAEKDLDASSLVLQRQEIERLTRQRDEARAVISTLEIVGKAADDERAQLRAEVERLRAEIERLTRERDEARAEVALLLLESEVLAKHEGSPGREWHSAGAWLLPGDRINVMRAPLPAMEAKP